MSCCRLAPGTPPDETIARLDRILEPYGGLGAIPRALQLSHWTVENELAQLQSFGFMLPLVFLLVAAFILNVALTRALALQRPQIAALKALGYDNVAIGWHYLKWALVIGALGVVIGIAAGAWLGHLIIGLYNQFFRFPQLLFSVPVSVVIGATILTLAGGGRRRVLGGSPRCSSAARGGDAAGGAGPLSPLGARNAAGGPPSRRRGAHGAAQRDPASASGRGLDFRHWFAVAILMIGLVFSDAIDRLIETQFWIAERQDVTVSFVEPRADAGAPRARASAGRDRRRAAAQRRRPRSRRPPRAVSRADRRAAGSPLQAHRRSRWATLSDAGRRASCCRRCSADVLGVTPATASRLEVLEGARPVRQVSVAGLVDDTMGLAMYMDLDDVHRLMREGDVASGALLLIDSAQRSGAVARALKSAAGGGRCRLQARGAAELSRHDGREHEPAASRSTSCSPASSRSASFTTPRACRCPSAAASWRACACSGSRARRSP